MSDRSDRSKVKELREELKTMAESLRRKAPPLPELVEELRTLVRHPRSLSTWIETRSPWLSRRFLGVASNLIEPFVAGMGLRVERLGEDVIEVVLPESLRNQGEGGAVHIGALSVLGEFAVRLYWEYHLDLRKSEIHSSRVQVRVLRRPVGEMRAVFRLPVSEREAVLHRLRAEGGAEVESQALVYDNEGRLVAEVDSDWAIARQLALGSGRET